MNREEQLYILSYEREYDIIIIGGGTTGLGCAVDAANRGFKTLLLEKSDFAKGTSSRSAKLVHDGVSYLAQGNIRLMKDGLPERNRLLQNAPHLCQKLSFVMPCYKWWHKWFYGFGLWVYEFLSGELSSGKTKMLTRKQTLRYLPDLIVNNINGGVLYFNGEFDYNRLAVNLAQTAIEQGATVVNYCGVTGFLKKGAAIKGVIAKDEIGGKEIEIKAKVVINATGVFEDELLQLAEGHSEKTIAQSQGIHLVEDKHLPKDYMVKVLPSGLVHVTCGEWVNYRSKAKLIINKAIQASGLEFMPCETKHLKIHGWSENQNDTQLSVYGTDASAITQMMKENASLSEKIHASYPYTKAEILWIIENEMVLTVEDILARRIRLLFLDARAAMEAAPLTVSLLALHNGKDKQWEKEQLETFNKLAQGYLLNLLTNSNADESKSIKNYANN